VCHQQIFTGRNPVLVIYIDSTDEANNVVNCDNEYSYVKDAIAVLHEEAAKEMLIQMAAVMTCYHCQYYQQTRLSSNLKPRKQQTTLRIQLFHENCFTTIITTETGI
jgi:hypothetical protein